MLSFFRKKEIPNNNSYFPIEYDMHAHILPGLDDGSPDEQTSITLIKGLMALGLKGSIATPHIISDLYKNDAVTIGKAFTSLQQALQVAQIDYHLRAAAEYMIDDAFMGQLQQKIPLLTVYENWVLTEFSYSEKPINIEHICFSMITEGYQPILAHPERYVYFHNDFKTYDHLHDMGFLLQVNLLSLTGYYGKNVAKAAMYIIKHQLHRLVGTDLHHNRHLEALSNADNKALFEKVFHRKLMNEVLQF